MCIRDRRQRGSRFDGGLAESEDGLWLALVDDLEIGGGKIGQGLAARIERHGIEADEGGRRRWSLCQKCGRGQSDGAKDCLGFRHIEHHTVYL